METLVYSGSLRSKGTPWNCAGSSEEVRDVQGPSPQPVAANATSGRGVRKQPSQVPLLTTHASVSPSVKRNNLVVEDAKKQLNLV